VSELAESIDGAEMIESITVDIVDQKEFAGQLLARAKEQNIELAGCSGHLAKNVLGVRWTSEMSEHLGL
jgi:hypothetical protein